jgi:hypothetical protein
MGLRWMRCGWRLFGRNPWQLGGMGGCSIVVIGVLGLIPVAGAPLVGLIVPLLLSGFYRALDATAKQKLRLPAALRLIALKQSPRELVSVMRDETQLMQVVVLGLFSMIVVVIASILVWSVLGTAAVNRMEFSWAALPRVIVALLVALSIAGALAASLIYTIPLAFIDHEALAPAMGRSLKIAGQHAYALIVVVAFLLAPFALGALGSLGSKPLGYALGLIAGAVVVPVVAAALYCSYRTVFAAADARAGSADPAPRKVVAVMPRRR